MRRDRSGLRAFVLQIALLAGPVVILILLGLHFLRQDRHLVEKEARERAEEVSRGILRAFARALTNFDAAAYLQLTNVWPEGTAFFQVDSNLDLVFPPPIQAQPEQRETILSSEQSNLWVRA